MRERLGWSRVSNLRRWSRQESVLLSLRLTKMLEDVPMSGNRAVRDSLLSEIRVLRESIDGLESGSADNPTRLKVVVEAASKIAKRNESLTKTLREAGYDGYSQKKEVRQIKVSSVK